MVKNVVIGCLALALLVSLLFHLRDPRAETHPRDPERETAPSAEPEEVAEAAPSEPEEEGEEGEEGEEDEDKGAAAVVVDPRLVALDEIIETAANGFGLAGSAIGFCLVDSSGERIYGHNADVAQIPASTLKTLTTATALEMLGPGFRFRTRLGIVSPDGETGGGGELVLVGGGDPWLTREHFESWANGLAEAGMKSVPGRIIGDGRLFPGSPFADFWNWGDIGNGYGSPVSGLNLGHNRFTAVFKPGEGEGSPAELVGIEPEVPGVLWLNESLTAAEGSGDGITIHGGERASVMHLRGTVPTGEEMRVRGAVPDPERFAAFHLREALLAAGVEVAGEAVGAGGLALEGETVPEMTEELLAQDSAPLREIVTSIHATSDNHEAECVYRMLGFQTGLPPDEAIRRHWRERGLELSGLRMVDGSGLARADHITPSSLALLQHFAATGPMGREYVESLLVAMDGAVRFKAGAMSAVRSFTGLFETFSGERLAFALIVNHYSDAAEVQALQRSLFEAIAEW